MSALGPRYIVGFSSEGRAEFDRLAPDPKGKVKRFWRRLSAGPIMPESMPLELRERDDLWRIAFGDWRIVFRLDSSAREIIITRVHPRKTAYIGLERPPRQ